MTYILAQQDLPDTPRLKVRRSRIALNDGCAGMGAQSKSFPDNEHVTYPADYRHNSPDQKNDINVERSQIFARNQV